MFRPLSRWRRYMGMFLFCGSLVFITMNTLTLIHQQAQQEIFNGTLPETAILTAGSPVEAGIQNETVGTARLDQPECDSKECLINYVKHLNLKQTVNNINLFEFTSGNDAVVIVIQVHDRVEYLKELIRSLSNVRGISEVLLIFSHDVYSVEVNKVIASIKFCLTMQIFYPFSLQIYTSNFPGLSPDDCKPGITKEKAKELGCFNADHHDKYGHYREPNITQIKHHWFWKMNHVFDHLQALQYFSGHVIFLEEDHYVVEDILVVFQQMLRLKQKSCPHCDIITLGTHDKKPTYVERAKQAEVQEWISSKHNMGMAIDRTSWIKIKNCAEKFCQYDDYNWDWTLQALGSLCLGSKIKALVARSPRVFHIGECGIHKKMQDCDSSKTISRIEQLIAESRPSLYPVSMHISAMLTRPMAALKPNGGWGDPRDHELCKRFAKDSDTHL